MRLYKQKDIPKQHRNPSDGPPRATPASPDARLPHRLKRAAEAVRKQIAGHKAMVSQFKESKLLLPPVVNNPLPLKRSNAVKGSVNVPLKAEVPKVLASVTGSKKHAASSTTSPKSRSPPPPPGLGTKKAAPPRAKNVVLTTVAAPSKAQSLSSQTRSPVQKTGTKSSASPAKRSATAANLASVSLTPIPEQDEVDEPLLPASCFRPLAEDPESEDEDWLTDELESTSDFDTQITQIFSLGLGPQSKDDVVQHGEVALPLVTPGATLAQTLEPMSALVEDSYEPEINFTSNSDGFETTPLHPTECVANDTPDIVSIPSVQPTSSPICSVSPIVSSDLVIQKSLSCQPPLSTAYYGSVSPIVSSDLVLQKSLSCQPPSSTDYEFVSYLGKGAFGAVLWGIHKRSRRDCAIKIISKAIVEEQDIVHAVLAEQHVMRQASDHPYLLGLLASFHDADNFYLISVSIHSPHLILRQSPHSGTSGILRLFIVRNSNARVRQEACVCRIGISLHLWERTNTHAETSGVRNRSPA